MVRKRKIILILLFIAICFCSYVEIDYQMYLKKKPVDTSVIEVVEGLSINYVSGKKIVVNGKHLEYQFSITNLGNEEKRYVIQIKDIVGDVSQVTYAIKDSSSSLKETGSLEEKNILADSILAGETKRYVLQVKNTRDDSFSFYLDTVYLSVDDSFKNVLLSREKVNEGDGLVQKTEQDGDVYYFRGNINDNYVSFAGLTWRVVKVNSDQSVKLVLDTTLENMVKFYNDEQSGVDNFEGSYIYQLLNDFYNLNLQKYDSLIASTIYCFDDSILTEEESKIQYLPSYRLFVDHLPTYSCSGTSLPLKIALLTADEVMFAGASSDNTSDYYLKGEFQSSWWTMTPSKKENEKMFFMTVTKDGVLQKDTIENTNLFFRPVISLNRRVRVEGVGTIEDPYVVITDL